MELILKAWGRGKSQTISSFGGAAANDKKKLDSKKNVRCTDKTGCRGAPP